MIDLVLKWAAISGILMVAASGLPTVRIKSWAAAFGGAAIFGVANLLLGSVLAIVAKLVTFPIAILSFGLVWLVIPIGVNMVMLKIADQATGDDMVIDGIPALFGLSTAVTITSALMNWVL